MNNKERNKRFLIDVVWKKWIYGTYKFIRNIFIPYDIEIEDSILVKTPFSFTPYITVILLVVLYYAASFTHFSIPFIFERITGIGNTVYVTQPPTAIEYFIKYIFYHPEVHFKHVPYQSYAKKSDGQF